MPRHLLESGMERQQLQQAANDVDLARLGVHQVGVAHQLGFFLAVEDLPQHREQINRGEDHTDGR